jgi:acetyl/propionyl-CoA carboxylase alpha subunit
MVRVLVANRGEIAIRIMRACQALGLGFVMVYTEEDKDSLHVRLALEEGGNNCLYRIVSYNDPNEILEIADYAKCTAIHPGYGFLAENYRFARRLKFRQRPLSFIGPNWEVIKELGDKFNTKNLAKKLGIPVIPGSDKPIYNEIEAENMAADLFHKQLEEGIEHPIILVKSSYGGGGMGIEEVRHLGELRRVYRSVRSYAKRQFGYEGVLLEKKFPVFNHIEVQLVCSQHGERVHYSTRNCTIQSIFRQKRIEVAPAFNPNYHYNFNHEEIVEKIIQYSLTMARHIGYDSVGTWEWIVTPSGEIYLLEVNPRIQVESGVSGLITQLKEQPQGVDLVREQVRLALGERLGYKQKHLHFYGASIEFRLVAEDTKRGFKPLDGVIKCFKLPQYKWLQIHTHIPQDSPYFVPSDYDPNLALLLVWGENIEEAKKRGEIVLDEVKIVGENTRGEKNVTNIDFLKEKLNHIQMFGPC